MRAIRILYLSAYWPRSQPLCGGEWRALGVGRALQELGSVQTIVVRSGAIEEARANKTTNELNVIRCIEPQRRFRTGLRGKIRWAVDPRVPYPLGCGADADASAFVFQKINDSDLVWFCNFRTPYMFENSIWPKSVLDVDDLPSCFEKSMLPAATGFRDWVARMVRVYSWRRRESTLGERFTVLATCSESDEAYLRKIGCTGPVHVIPNGFDQPTGEPVRRPATPPRIGFVGPFSHPPNLEGIRWFAKECWPLIKQRAPDARLRIVGKGSETELKPIGSDIDGLGWVSDLASEVASWSLMVIPIRSGAGTRVKLAQALSLKCPVVSTSYGAYGYDATDGSYMLLADSADAFAKACIDVVGSPNQAQAMADKGWKEFLQKWTWNAIAPRVWAAAEECLRRSKTLHSKV
ncbi:MAG: glycosyltransferase family 4 protein [Verrucomicrobia bacterium]|nr:glycosyltransferase family 4 protein [Verrucomicrobiota bacterium]